MPLNKETKPNLEFYWYPQQAVSRSVGAVEYTEFISAEG